MDKCSNCLCPNNDQQVNAELEREKALEENEKERRRLIQDLEKAGVTFPVTELEAMASPRILGPRADSEDPPGASGADMTAGGDLTSQDYATNMPEDLKDLLRRYYQLEAEREALKGGTTTAPNSENGDMEERPPEPISKPPRVPFWFFRRRNPGTVEGQNDYEAQEEQSAKLTNAGRTGDDRIHDAPSGLYRKESRTRRHPCLTFLCCLVFAGLIISVVYLAAYHEDDVAQPSQSLPAETIVTVVESPPVAAPTEAPCTPEVEVTNDCFVRGEPIVAKFQNCNPRKCFVFFFVCGWKRGNLLMGSLLHLVVWVSVSDLTAFGCVCVSFFTDFSTRRIPVGDDWLGVYEFDVPHMALSEDSYDWMYLCGNKQCRGVVQSSVVSLNVYRTGSYRIHLIRDATSAPYKAFASSWLFKVVSSPLDCPDEVELEDLTAEEDP